MLAHYGYRDASGDFFITIDTDRCDGCGKCVRVCPVNIFEVFDEDPNDPMRDEPVAAVRPDKQGQLKYKCGPCKPTNRRTQLPCVEACEARAISHSW